MRRESSEPGQKIYLGWEEEEQRTGPSTLRHTLYQPGNLLTAGRAPYGPGGSVCSWDSILVMILVDELVSSHIRRLLLASFLPTCLFELGVYARWED